MSTDENNEGRGKSPWHMRCEVTEEAIKRGLVEGWLYVYAWEQVQGEKIVFIASRDMPDSDARIMGNITRYELGEGLVLDWTELQK